MLQFFQTVMGKRFFEQQIPKLIQQLTRIADAMEESNRLKQEELSPKSSNE